MDWSCVIPDKSGMLGTQAGYIDRGHKTWSETLFRQSVIKGQNMKIYYM
jgi:hypothetical protein